MNDKNLEYMPIQLIKNYKYKCKVHGEHDGFISYYSEYEDIKIYDKCYFEFFIKNCCQLEEIKNEMP